MATTKCLVDECLNAGLDLATHHGGEGESSQVGWIGHGVVKDRDPLPVVLGRNCTRVVHNACDFRGPPKASG